MTLTATVSVPCAGFAVPGKVNLRRCSDLVGTIRRSHQLAYAKRRRHSIHDVPNAALAGPPSEADDSDSDDSDAGDLSTNDRRRDSAVDDLHHVEDDDDDDDETLKQSVRRLIATPPRRVKRKTKRLTHVKQSKYRHLPPHLRPKRKPKYRGKGLKTKLLPLTSHTLGQSPIGV